MTTTAIEAKRIRTELKAQGISTKQVSVRTHNYSMGSSLNIRIKDPKVLKSLVEKIANESERVSRCEVSGEILSGGNRFVFVDYASEAIETVALELVARLENVLAVRHLGRDTEIYSVGRHGHGVSVHSSGAFQLWHGGRSLMYHLSTPEAAARVIAEDTLSKGLA